MKINSRNNNIRLALTIALSFALGNASAATVAIDFSTTEANLSKWHFSDGLQDNNLDKWITMDMSGDSPKDSTYVGDSLDYSDPNYNGYWTAIFKFPIPELNPYEINISLFAADDRAQVFLDNTLLASAGLFATSAGSEGYFQSSYTPSIPPDVVTYYWKDSLYDFGTSKNLTEWLDTGDHILKVIINNTDYGIKRNPTPKDPTLDRLTEIGPTHFTLQGKVEFYDAPEPPSIFLILAGFLAFVMFNGKRRIINRRLFICHPLECALRSFFSIFIKSKEFRIAYISKITDNRAECLSSNSKTGGPVGKQTPMTFELARYF
ncbi:hypothetical protein RO575_20450 [Methylomonas sp. MO1]|uniref:hypothetical protein n=1 Tax=unclassified Methylomonas TaxID=2608980 RepID=UPI00047B1FC8|nr:MULTISPECIES: hypothetical protein [unclassified Methylomonas]MDT4291942.1 hypothetical protein [Methylomonas sp. MO1]